MLVKAHELRASSFTAHLYLDQPMLTLSPDTTQGSTAVPPSDTWMLFGAVVILKSAGEGNHDE